MKPVFRSALAWAVAAGVAVACGCVGERAWAAHRAHAALRRAEQTWRMETASRPAPTATELAADLAATSAALQAARAASARSREAIAELERAGVPAGAADAFFDLAGFGERMRRCARQHHVEVAPEERFGFAAYAHAGPPAAALAGVFRQRLLMERLLERVFAAEPRELVLVEREPVAGEVIPERTAAPDAGGAMVFRVGFTGETAALRSLLNALATSELPWVVRTVEVQPATVKRPSSPNLADAPEVLVARELSRCVVSVECAALPPAANELAPTTAPSSGTDASALAEFPELTMERVWHAPHAQQRGDDWIYEVFTPPQIRYEQRSGRLTAVRGEMALTPAATAATVGDADFRLRLKRVEAVPFRLQLVGYVGSRDAPRGVFENMLSGEMLVMGSPNSLDALALTVEQVVVERGRPTEAVESLAAPLVAKAIVRDERTGARVTLTSDLRLYTSELVAMLAPATAGAEAQLAREGDLVHDGAIVYRIDKIQLAPAAVSVTKWGASQLAPESRTLVLQPEAIAEQSSGSL